MKLCFGENVVSQEGTRLGALIRVRLARESREVVGIVVDQSDQLPVRTFIPVDMIEGETNQQLTLLISTQEAKQIATSQPGPTPLVEETAVGPSAPVPGTPETGGVPAVAHHQLDLTDQVAAHCVDGVTGRLSCLLTDPYTNAITSVLFKGIQGTDKTVEVPATWVVDINETVIGLSCTKDQLLNLPEPAPGFYIPVEGPEGPEERAQG